MRILPVLAVLLAGTAAAMPRIAPPEAARHRGERVTLSGTVSAVETRPDGALVMIGSAPAIPVRVPESARARLGHELSDLRGREIELTGTLSGPAQPLELVLERPEQLADAGSGSAEDMRTLRERVRDLEDQVARLRAAVPVGGKTGIVYGPTTNTKVDIPPYATQATVLAERGIPSRTGWGPQGHVLYYGRERWIFDENGQLLRVERDR